MMHPLLLRRTTMNVTAFMRVSEGRATLLFSDFCNPTRNTQLTLYPIISILELFLSSRTESTILLLNSMSLVTLQNVLVLDNPAPFTNAFQFEVTFEALQDLEEDLEWRVTYVGSAGDDNYDQVLDEVMVGPVPLGTNKFVLTADPPDASKIPPTDILGVTVVLVTVSYREQEFCRVGYYVNNEFTGGPVGEDGYPIDGSPVDVANVQRQILSDKPRVTRFPIDWGMGTTVDATGASADATMEDENIDPAAIGGEAKTVPGTPGVDALDDAPLMA